VVPSPTLNTIDEAGAVMMLWLMLTDVPTPIARTVTE